MSRKVQDIKYRPKKRPAMQIFLYPYSTVE